MNISYPNHNIYYRRLSNVCNICQLSLMGRTAAGSGSLGPQTGRRSPGESSISFRSRATCARVTPGTSWEMWMGVKYRVHPGVWLPKIDTKNNWVSCWGKLLNVLKFFFDLLYLNFFKYYNFAEFLECLDYYKYIKKKSNSGLDSSESWGCFLF